MAIFIYLFLFILAAIAILIVIFFRLGKISQWVKELNVKIAFFEIKINETMAKLSGRANQRYTEILSEIKNYKQENPVIDTDEYFEDAKNFVIKQRKVSASLLQRHFKISYAKAAQLLDKLEEEGIIGPADGARPRLIIAEETADEESSEEI